MGVVTREKVKGSGIWWVFVNHQGQRRARRVGDRKTAEAVAIQLRARLVLGDEHESHEVREAARKVSAAKVLGVDLATLEHGFSLPADLRRLVYSWRRGNQVLYVGQSNIGPARPFKPHHHALGGQIQPGDKIDILPVPEGMSLDRAEREAIAALKPTMNKRK